MKKLELVMIGVMFAAVICLASCGGGGGGTTSGTDEEAAGGGELEGGGGTGGSAAETSNPLSTFSLSNINLDPESLLVTNSSAASANLSAKVALKQPGGSGFSGQETDFSMVGYMQEMLQDEVSWHAGKVDAEFRLFDWAVNQEILPVAEVGVVKYAHITWPEPVENDVEAAGFAGGEFMDVFKDEDAVIERYYKYTIADDGTWQVDMCREGPKQFLQYDRLVSGQAISSTAILVDGHIIDSYETGGVEGGVDMSGDMEGMGLEKGTSQVAMIFKNKIVDSRTLKEGATGTVDFDETESGSQTAYFKDNFGQGMIELTLDNSDTANPLNTVRGAMNSSFEEGDDMQGSITAVNGLGVDYSFEGMGTDSMGGSAPAMDVSMFCNDLSGYVCMNMGPESMPSLDACVDFFMGFDGSCSGTNYAECFSLTDNGLSATCTLSFSHTEAYYMDEDAYGYPQFHKVSAVSNSAISDALSGLSALGLGDLQDVNLTRTWDCTATWDVEADKSDADLPDDIKAAFAKGYAMISHKGAGDKMAEEQMGDMCPECGYQGTSECFDPSCFCAANPNSPECGSGGGAYCENHPEDPMCLGGGYDYCDLHPEDPMCTEYTPKTCEEMCAEAPQEYLSDCLLGCESSGSLNCGGFCSDSIIISVGLNDECAMACTPNSTCSNVCTAMCVGGGDDCQGNCEALCAGY